MTTELAFRRVATLPEYHDCVAIQRETWGAEFRECVPATILMVAQKLGGVVAGAFARDGGMLGFVFGMAGVIDGRPAHWSDMLAVRPAPRGAHVGERLKCCQRELARAAGAEAMYWTFDPLVARNAHLNLARLGAHAVEYAPNLYGDGTSSPLHGDLPTDRLVVRWDLGSGAPSRNDADRAPPAPNHGQADSTTSDAATPPAHRDPVVNPVAPDGAPTMAGSPLDAPVVRIVVPHDVESLSPALRAAWRATVRDAFLLYRDRGYRVTTFRRASDGALPYYELEHSATSLRAPSDALFRWEAVR